MKDKFKYTDVPFTWDADKRKQAELDWDWMIPDDDLENKNGW